ncbi:class I SAM-dependent methyltransferase [Streptomyces goshikiensis]|uniref:class I SAM-dependent methyltransferase n=2 Tax=Streptomyces TaxID=1883 RepID=UPI0009394F25|nr:MULTISPECIES: class I SAM-dependent methyltransferase [Streptomyces]PJN15513.1 class I SAM-dependent methyltransferase [Streptomyces sp. CB02120-2]GHD78236.1 hypothetical protein GCM10010336_58600 [Streptomyces goshikiensis]
MAVVVIGEPAAQPGAALPPAVTAAFEAVGLRTHLCRPGDGDPLPATLTGADALVLACAGPEALPLLRAALAAEVPVLALGGGAPLLDRAAAQPPPLPPAAGADPLRGAGEGAYGHGFRRLGGSAWALPGPLGDPAGAAPLHRFAALAAARAEHTATRAFFTPRADAWEERFAYQAPAYEAAVARMRLRPGQTVLDLGCGSGRALPALRAGVGAGGTVLGVDLTPAMLTAAARAGRRGPAGLLVADCGRLPLPAGAVHGIFAAGLLDHLPQPRTALTEWARVCAPGAELLLFHPSGRAERAARHGRPVSPDDPLAEPNLRPALDATGWRLAEYEDAVTHFVARARRRVRASRCGGSPGG